MLSLDAHLCFALHDAARAMTKAYQPELGRLGLTYPQYLVLLVLWERDAIAVKELGRRLSLDSGTLSPLLKRLEARGYVVRSRSSIDERVVEVRLTATGRRSQRGIPAVQDALACATGLSLEQATQLRQDLQQLTRHIRNELADTKAGVT
jgi:DNA-binding MarR family transcriptional regulator